MNKKIGFFLSMMIIIYEAIENFSSYVILFNVLVDEKIR